MFRGWFVQKILLLQVQEKLPWFLKAVPSAECAKGGVGGYNNAVQMDPADPTGIAGLSDGQVMASSFRTYYVPLNTQQNFIDAYQVSQACAVVHACNKVHKSDGGGKDLHLTPMSGLSLGFAGLGSVCLLDCICLFYLKWHVEQGFVCNGVPLQSTNATQCKPLLACCKVVQHVCWKR